VTAATKIFAGYDRYRTDMLLNTVRGLLPGALRARLFGELSGHLPRGRLRTAADDLAHDTQRAHFRSVSYFRDPEKTGLFTPELRALLRGYDSESVLGAHYARVDGRDPLSGILYVDLKTYLPDRMLMKVDKMAMMHSLEVRSPFLDQFVVEMGLRIPAGLKIRDGQGKWILKKTMERMLPNDILYRRKQGFDVPLAAWLRGPVAEPLEAALGALGRRGHLRGAELTRLFDEHRSGTADHAHKLWILYMLELWHRVFRVSP
jgi:asparagine synthase (glutamine-hydrolysing)